VDWEGREFARLCGGTGESNRRRGGLGRILRIVQCVGEAGAPVTEIARNDEECVCAREVRSENASECFLFLLVDGSNKDRDDGDFFPKSEIDVVS
jgi:hypothetical protein